MFVSDLFNAGATPPDPALLQVAGTCYALFEGMVAATLPDADDRAIKATTIAHMSSSYGFALLRMDDRLKPFMYGRLTQSELIDAVLSTKVTALPRAAGRKRRNST